MREGDVYAAKKNNPRRNKIERSEIPPYRVRGPPWILVLKQQQQLCRKSLARAKRRRPARSKLANRPPPLLQPTNSHSSNSHSMKEKEPNAANSAYLFLNPKGDSNDHDEIKSDMMWRKFWCGQAALRCSRRWVGAGDRKKVEK